MRVVLDRGFDGAREFALLDEYFESWCVRQRADRQVYLPGAQEPTRMRTVANCLRLDQVAKVTRVRDGKLVEDVERFGYCTVQLPVKASRNSRNKPACKLRGLVVVERKDPLDPLMVLLTSRPPRSAAQARRWVRDYRRRWSCEEQTRAGKQCADIEDLRVLRWDAIVNLVTLTVMTEGLLALLQVEAPRRAANLARRAPIDGDAPPLALYRIWMSVALALGGVAVWGI